MGRHGPGSGVVISGCRFCDSSSRGMLDGLIDPSRLELESALSSMGSIGMGLKLRLKYHAGPPRGAQGHGFGGIFQVLDCLAPRAVLPVAGIGLTAMNQGPERALIEFCTSC